MGEIGARRMLPEELVVCRMEFRGPFEEGQRAGCEYAEAPVAARAHDLLLLVLGEIALRAVTHPHRVRQLLIDPIDVAAEQGPRQKIERGILGARLPCGQHVVPTQTLVDLRPPPSPPQEIADHGGTRQQLEQPAAPSRAL